MSSNPEAARIEPPKEEVLAFVGSIKDHLPFKGWLPHRLLLYLIEAHYDGTIAGGKKKVLIEFYEQKVQHPRNTIQSEVPDYPGSKFSKALQKLRTILRDLNADDKCPFLIEIKDDPYFDLRIERKTILPTRETPQVVEAKNDTTIVAPSLPLPEAGFAYGLPALGVFKGRDAERDAALALWRANPTAPLLIWGPAAIGKSTLALAVLQHPEIAQHFGARRFRVRCEELRSAGTLKLQMGSEWFGLRPQAPIVGQPPDLRQIESQVIRSLSAAPAACIIDNFETPHRNDPKATEGWLKVLLGIEGVWLIVTTQGYDQPGGVRWGAIIKPDPLSLECATDLFCEITMKETHRSDPRLPALLDDMAGVPHAIELLAHQAVHLDDLGPLMARWHQKGTPMLRRLGGDSREFALSVVYQFAIEENPFIDAPTRRLLRTLACLPQGAHESDVSGIFDTIGQISASDAADKLLRAALVQCELGRLRLLPPLRDHVLRAYNLVPESSKLIREHFLAKTMEMSLLQDQDANVLNRLSNEFLNIQWAIEEGLDANDSEAIYPACAMAIFTCLSGLGANDVISRAMKLANEIGDLRAAAECVFVSGEFARYSGQIDEATGAYLIALDMYDYLDMPFGVATCFLRLGEIIPVNASAHAHFLAALKSYERCDDAERLWGRGRCYQNLAALALRRNSQAEASGHGNEALAVFRSCGDRFGEAGCENLLGDIAIASNDDEKAREHFNAALSIHESFGSSVGIAECRTRLAELEKRCGNFSEATSLYKSSLAFCQSAGYRPGEAQCLYGLGEIARLTEISDEALEYFAEAIPIFRAMRDRLGEARCSMSAGIVALLKSDHDQAIKSLESARDIFESVEATSEAAECLHHLASIKGSRL